VAWQGVPGSYAEQVLVPATHLIRVPEGVSDLEAAALPVQGLTAHYLATSSFPVQPGNTVVVHAGAGGVGLLLTQIVKLRGARVISTVSTPEKARRSREAGAGLVAGYHDFPDIVHRQTAGKGAAAVFDGLGKDTFDKSLRSLARRGALVLFGLASGHVPPFDLDLLNHAGSLTITRPTLRDFVTSPAELRQRTDQLWNWMARRRLNLRVGHSQLTDVASAHRDLEARRTTGKVLFIP
jgi:NADPH2:quinone reductase